MKTTYLKHKKSKSYKATSESLTISAFTGNGIIEYSLGPTDPEYWKEHGFEEITREEFNSAVDPIRVKINLSVSEMQ